MLQNSYLLRFWRVSPLEAWRVTLISIAPDAIEQHFTTVDECLRYLNGTYPSVLAFPTAPANFIGDSDNPAYLSAE